MRNVLWAMMLMLAGCTGLHNRAQANAFMRSLIEKDQLVVYAGDSELLRYQITTLADPIGGERFPVSAFIHPLRTPDGFVMTEIQPSDHLHHLGFWWAWKFIEVDGKRSLNWELQAGEGLLRGKRIASRGGGETHAWFIAENEAVDLKNYDGERVLLNERVEVRVWRPFALTENQKGYFVDIVIHHTPAVDSPVTIAQYRYSGFAYRGPQSWNKDNSTILTSEDRDRDHSNFERARWVRIAGEADEGAMAGLVIMSHPDNPSHPEHLRTWSSSTHHGSIFMNVNPVFEGPMVIQPDETNVRRYRLFVYDGQVDAPRIEQLWQDYARTADAADR